MITDIEIVESRLISQSCKLKLPELIEQHQKQWKKWRTEINVGQALNAKHIHAVCPLSCFDDINYAINIGQLLTLQWLDVSFIFVLPTQAAAALFSSKAKDHSFAQLINVTSSDKLAEFIQGLDSNALIGLLPFQSMLLKGFVAQLKEAMGRANETTKNDVNAGILRAENWLEQQQTVNALLWGNYPANSAIHYSLKDFARSGKDEPLSVLRMNKAFLNEPGLSAKNDPQAKEEFKELEGSVRNSRIELNMADSFALEWSRLIIRQKPNLYSKGYKPLYRRGHGYGGSGSDIKMELPYSVIGKDKAEVEMLLTSGTEDYAYDFSLQLPASQLEPSMVTCYLNRGGGGNPMVRAFADGIACKLRYAEDETGPRPGVPIVWGVLRGSDRVIEWAKKAGQYFFYIDHAYFGRGHGNNYRITRNGYEAGRIRKCPDDRIAKYNIQTKPWQKGSGENILVCPPTDYFMAAHNCSDWLPKTLEKLKKTTDRPIVVRKKPKPGESVEPLEEAFRKAFALVTHSSNVAIEAVIAGVPVFVSPSSAAAPVGQTDLDKIETPVYPQRNEWLAHLAYSQFSFEEIKSGEAWRMLLQWEEREFI